MIYARVGKLQEAGRVAARKAQGRARRVLRGGNPEPTIGPPIFIVGCGHSGTTLLLSILSVHSRLHSLPYETSMAEVTDSELDWFVHRFNTEAAAAGKARWIEKTPRHIYRIGRLLDRFPDGKVLLMIRDGRDVASSLRARTGDLEGGAQRWLDDNSAAEPFHAHPRVTIIKYEDLVATRQETLQSVLGFLDEGFEPALMRHETGGFRFYGIYRYARQAAKDIDELTEAPASVDGANHRLHRSWQARQAVFDGRGRWRDDLDPAEAARVEAIIGSKLNDYGYI